MSDGTPGDLDFAIDNAGPEARERRRYRSPDLYRLEMTLACVIDAVRRLARDPNDQLYREKALELTARARKTLLRIRG